METKDEVREGSVRYSLLIRKNLKGMTFVLMISENNFMLKELSTSMKIASNVRLCEYNLWWVANFTNVIQPHLIG